MSTPNKKIVYRFIKNISEYEEGGDLYTQIIPLDTQVYCQYDTADKTGLYYVIGDGYHTYTELRDGQGNAAYTKEYKTITQGVLNSKIDTLIAGENIEITGTDNTRTISANLDASSTFMANNALDTSLQIGSYVENIVLNGCVALNPNRLLVKLYDIVVFKTRFALFVTNVSYTDNISTVAGTIINTPGSFANITGDPRDNEALDNELSRIDAALENVDIELAAINANIGYISDRLTQINGE